MEEILNIFLPYFHLFSVSYYWEYTGPPRGGRRDNLSQGLDGLLIEGFNILTAGSALKCFVSS